MLKEIIKQLFPDEDPNNHVTFNELLGKTIVKIEQLEDLELIFYTENEIFRMFHDHDCSENVYIESITGDLNDLIGTPILIAEESSNEKNENLPNDFDTIREDIEKWTFYKLATIKGYVDIRWHGSSNGYYSVEVDFVKTNIEECNKIKKAKFCGYSERSEELYEETKGYISNIRIITYLGAN